MSDYPTQSPKYQLWILAMAAAMVVASLLLHSVSGSDARLRLTGTSTPLPEICMVRRVFGVRCPGSGLTRSVVATARGEIAAAIKHHPAGPLIFFWAVVHIPYRIANLWRLWKSKRAWACPGTSAMLLLLTGICLVQWVACG